MTATLDVALAVLIGGGLLGMAFWRSGRRRSDRGQHVAPGRIGRDIPTGRVVIASSLARSRRG